MYSGICRTGKSCTPLDLLIELAINAAGGTGFFGKTISGVKVGGRGFLGKTISGVKTGGFDIIDGGWAADAGLDNDCTGNIETLGACCLGGAGWGFFGPTTAVMLISPPDKALA